MYLFHPSIRWWVGGGKAVGVSKKLVSTSLDLCNCKRTVGAEAGFCDLNESTNEKKKKGRCEAAPGFGTADGALELSDLCALRNALKGWSGGVAEATKGDGAYPAWLGGDGNLPTGLRC